MERKKNRVIVEGEGQEGKIVLNGVDMKRRRSEVGGEEDEMVPENPVDLHKGELENRIGIENGEGKGDGREAVQVKKKAAVGRKRKVGRPKKQGNLKDLEKKGNGEDLGGDCDGDLRGIGDLGGKGGEFVGGKELPKRRGRKRKENGQGDEVVSVKKTVNQGGEEKKGNGEDLGWDSGNLRGKGEGFVGGKEEPKRRGRKRKGSENLGGNEDSVKKTVNQGGQGKKENGDLGGNGVELDSEKKVTTRRGRKKKGNENLDGIGGESFVVKKSANPGGRKKKGNEKDSEIDIKNVRENGGLAGKGEENGVGTDEPVKKKETVKIISDHRGSLEKEIEVGFSANK